MDRTFLESKINHQSFEGNIIENWYKSYAKN